ncbi:entericidin A/B family lipoprotein [Neisseriaceae bacterium TC5R-5]|nr:entericidin A/B family lipoprotein [Neisseriaceae bacterium TC5R-5]
MKKLFSLLGLLVLLTACNTIQGVGKDVSKGGQAVEKAAKDVSNKM